MRAVMSLAIALAGLIACQALVAAPGDDDASSSANSAENAVLREQAAASTSSQTEKGAGGTATSTDAASRSSPSTDAPVKEPEAQRKLPTKPSVAAEKEGEFKIPHGYKPRVRDGQTVYCRKEGEKGTRFMKTMCYTLADLKYKVEMEQAAADELTRRARVCSTAAVCSSN